MSVQYQYNYARVDETGFCYEVCSSTSVNEGDDYIEISEYNEDYLFKYYINGAWYEDAEATIPWSPEN